MTFLELQKLCLSRLGDEAWIHLGTGATDIEPTSTNLIILKMEINSAYTEAANRLARQGFYMVQTQSTITFASGTKEKNLLLCMDEDVQATALSDFVGAAATTTITSATALAAGAFTQSLVGRQVSMTGGTNVTAGTYTIVTVNTAGSIALNVTPCTGNTVNGAGFVALAKPRKILFLGIYPGADTTKEPTPCDMSFRGNVGRRPSGMHDYADLYFSGGSSSDLYLRGYYLGFHVTPTATTRAKVVYAPICENMTADTAVPEQVPVEHHEYIAQLAAVNIAGAEKSEQTGLYARMIELRNDLEQVGSDLNDYSPHMLGAFDGG